MRRNYTDDIVNRDAYPGNIPGYDIENAELCTGDYRKMQESHAWSLMAIAKILMDIRDELRKMNERSNKNGNT